MDRAVAGRLLDVSEFGIGIESYVELPSGAEVAMRAELADGEMALFIAGTAVVRQCRQLDSGLFRSGLELASVAWSRSPEVAVCLDA